jgi:hypothetical protein
MQDRNQGTLTKPGFLEASEKGSFAKYSVFWSGKSGGPNFSVSMHSSLPELGQGQACIGKVVKGQGVLDAIMQIRQQKKIPSLFRIESVRVVGSASDSTTIQ